jgi:hypothetical protein
MFYKNTDSFPIYIFFSLFPILDIKKKFEILNLRIFPKKLFYYQMYFLQLIILGVLDLNT